MEATTERLRLEVGKGGFGNEYGLQIAIISTKNQNPMKGVPWMHWTIYIAITVS